MSGPTLQILAGDNRETLKSLPDESVHCCVTSPPYWGLRDYGVDGQIGLELTPAAFVDQLAGVFAQVHRVLRKDGTLWLNLGDTYAADRGGTHMPAQTVAGGDQGKGDAAAFRGMGDQWSKRAHRQAGKFGLKHKDLVGIPWRVAFALQAAGWYLRQDIIWHKPNPMPESVTDRCTKAHEYIFLLTKSAKYHYDAAAIFEPVSEGTNLRLSQNLADQIGSHRANGGDKTNGPMKAVGRKSMLAQRGQVRANADFENATCLPVTHRNKRSVWTVPTQSYSDAHFATFPPALIQPCILAGCPVGGTVLDPFGGSGTTGQVALELGRSAILCELNPEYVALIKQRCAITPGLHLE